MRIPRHFLRDPRAALAGILLAAAWSMAAPATLPTGEPIKVALDPAKSKVEFNLGATLHTVHGSFQLKRGNVEFDPVTGKVAGEVVVDAASGDSGSKARDRRMHNDVLQTPRFPEISFRASRVEGRVNPQGHSQVQIAGVFHLCGADHELTAPAEVEIEGNHVSGTVHFQVPYVDWGLKNPSTLFLRVDREVNIELHLDGTLMAGANHP
ncbi:MAG TPA: YceI family protein [Bryobacteraceae bacterium]|nr:YceI family protein [Bryobacteraceae bacterium]